MAAQKGGWPWSKKAPEAPPPVAVPPPPPDLGTGTIYPEKTLFVLNEQTAADFIAKNNAKRELDQVFLPAHFYILPLNGRDASYIYVWVNNFGFGQLDKLLILPPKQYYDVVLAGSDKYGNVPNIPADAPPVAGGAKKKHSLEKRTVDELRKLAKERGISGVSKMNKQQLIDKLRAHK